MELIKKLLTPSPEKLLKPLYKMADAIDALEPEYEKLTDEQLREKTKKLQARAQGGESLDDLLSQMLNGRARDLLDRCRRAQNNVKPATVRHAEVAHVRLVLKFQAEVCINIEITPAPVVDLDIY